MSALQPALLWWTVDNGDTPPLGDQIRDLIDITSPADMATAVAAVVGGIVVGVILAGLFKGRLRRMAEKSDTPLDDILLRTLTKPLVLFTAAGGIAVASGTLYWEPAPSIEAFLGGVVTILSIVAVTWFASSFTVDLIGTYLGQWADKTETDSDDVLVPVLQRVARILIITMGIITLLLELDVNLVGVLSGLGVGGVAMGFAAKDIFAHWFGGATVMVDRHIKVGDTVNVSGIRGTIQQMGLRTTTVESYDGTKLVVPNAEMSNAIVENISSRVARRFVVTLGLVYGTPAARMERACEILIEICTATDGVRDDCFATFAAYGPSSMDIEFVFWASDMDAWRQIRHNVNMAILERFEAEGLEFAFPTQTLFIEQDAAAPTAT